MLIFFAAEIHPTLPPNHIRFNETETMMFAKWITSLIVGTDIPKSVSENVSEKEKRE